MNHACNPCIAAQGLDGPLLRKRAGGRALAGWNKKATNGVRA